MDVVVSPARGGGDRNVHVAAAQAFPLMAQLPLANGDFNARVGLCEVIQKPAGKASPAAPLRHVNRAGASFASACKPCGGNGLLDLCNDRAGGSETDFSGRGQGHPRSTALKHRGSDLSLEGSDLAGKGRLSDV